MEAKDYILDRIEGEYAYLKDIETGNEMFIAMALLPAGTDIGTHLRCEYMQYTIVD